MGRHQSSEAGARIGDIGAKIATLAHDKGLRLLRNIVDMVSDVNFTKNHKLFIMLKPVQVLS